MPAHEPQVHLAIGSRFENIELVQVVVSESLRLLDLDDDTSYWIGLAVREAVANAIKHGNQEDPGKQVEIDFGLDGEDVVIQICDQGTGFDPDGVKDPLAPENVLSPTGRGIFYMKSFMDEIDYTFRPDGGTVLTLRKRITSALVGGKEQREDE